MTKWEHTIRIYENQDFESIRLECLKNQKLFEDPIFPAKIESLSNNYQKLISNWHEITWKRPGEIVDNPQLIVNGIKRTDPTQGDLGNCWFIAAMSALTQNSIVLKRVIPDNQSFNKDWYGE
jgi:hypothetical protein